MIVCEFASHPDDSWLACNGLYKLIMLHGPAK